MEIFLLDILKVFSSELPEDAFQEQKETEKIIIWILPK